MQLVILAGGKGTRMGSLTAQIPKPMIPLAGKPLLEYQIELAARYGCRDILLLTGHLGERIEEYFKDGSRWGVRLRYRREDRPLGTAGAIKDVETWLEDDFLVFYGDIMMDVDLAALIAFHDGRKPLATLVAHPNNHPYDSDLFEVDKDGRVIAFHPKPREGDRFYRNIVNAALYVLNRGVLRYVPEARSLDLGRDIFPQVVRSGEAVFAYNTPEYISDVGTPERLMKIEADVVSGKVARLNIGNRRAAVFLDRDGVLNVDVDHVRSADQLEVLPGVPEAIRRINQSEYLAVVVSNQPGIAKGFFSEQDLDRIHAKLETLLGAKGAYLDRIYYCPHHPEKGFPGERLELKIPCACRKPAPGMILTAAAELNIDLKKSCIVGDTTTDVQAGVNAGVRTIRLCGSSARKEARFPCTADYECQDLGEAADFVLGRPA